jgi:cell division septal protein FtsQ
VKKYILPFGLFLFVLCILLIKFGVKVQISCHSQYGDCPSEIKDQLSPLNGKNMFVAEKESKKKLESNLLVSEFSMQFKLPNILKIDVIVKKPLFALQNTDGFALIDKDGIVLAQTKNSSLPSVIVKDVLPQVGGKIDANSLFALELIEGVYKMYQVKVGNIEENTLLVDLTGQIRVIFPLVGADRDILLGSLRLIYADIQNPEKGTTFSQIDLRYKNPVLR